jgi:hypothetical protein
MGWKILSPEYEEVGFVWEGSPGFSIVSESLGINSPQRNTLRKAVEVIALEWQKQREIKSAIERRKKGSDKHKRD